MAHGFGCGPFAFGGWMIAPGYQSPNPIMLTCPTCGVNAPNKFPWASQFILTSCANTACPDVGRDVTWEKASLAVVTVTGGK